MNKVFNKNDLEKNDLMIFIFTVVFVLFMTLFIPEMSKYISTKYNSEATSSLEVVKKHFYKK